MQEQRKICTGLTHITVQFHIPTKAGIKAKISSQYLAYGWPGELMEAFVPETWWSPFFNWRKLMSRTAEYGLLIASAGLNDYMDQNWLHIPVRSAFAILLHWSLGCFVCKDHTGSHFFDERKCGKELSFLQELVAYRQRMLQLWGESLQDNYSLLVLPSYLQDEHNSSCFGKVEILFLCFGKAHPSAAITGPLSRSSLKLCPFVPYHHSFLFCPLHPHLR